MATIEDRDRLLNHNSSTDAVKDISLTLAVESNFRHSTEALLACPTMQQVTIAVHSSFSQRWQTEKEDILAFFRAVGGQSQLKSLRILAASFGTPVELSSSLLVQLLKNTLHLERLKIHGMIIDLDSSEAKNDLAATFQYHPSLSEVSIVRSLFQSIRDGDGGDDQPEDFNDAAHFPKLFTALATIPNLENLGIHYRYRRNTSTNNAIAKLPRNFIADLGQPPNLTHLYLFNCGIDEDHLEALADHFHSFETLEELSLSTQIFGLRASQAIANILAVNASLTNLYLEPRKGCPALDANCTNLIANALENNPDSALQAFVLEDLMVSSLDPFVKVLRVHCRLEVLTIKAVQSNVWHQTEIEYLLKLNEIGRYDLFHSTPSPRSKWVEALIASEGDLHCLFYLLSANPLLCQSNEEI